MTILMVAWWFIDLFPLRQKSIRRLYINLFLSFFDIFTYNFLYVFFKFFFFFCNRFLLFLYAILLYILLKYRKKFIRNIEVISMITAKSIIVLFFKQFFIIKSSFNTATSWKEKFAIIICKYFFTQKFYKKHIKNPTVLET